MENNCDANDDDIDSDDDFCDEGYSFHGGHSRAPSTPHYCSVCIIVTGAKRTKPVELTELSSAKEVIGLPRVVWTIPHTVSINIALDWIFLVIPSKSWIFVGDIFDPLWVFKSDVSAWLHSAAPLHNSELQSVRKSLVETKITQHTAVEHLDVSILWLYSCSRCPSQVIDSLLVFLETMDKRTARKDKGHGKWVITEEDKETPGLLEKRGDGWRGQVVVERERGWCCFVSVFPWGI